MNAGTGRLTRGELARQCGVNSETVRYYEQRGLIPLAIRSAGNYRLFAPETVRRVGFIKRAQELGFTLKEIEELLSLRAQPQACCTAVSARVEAKIADIDRKVAALKSMREELRRLKRECPGEAPISECRVLGALDGRRR